jgi:hypothetical protein
VKTVNVTIKGTSPLLMHCFPLVPVEALEKKPIEEQAKACEYRTPDGKLYIPAVALGRALVNGGAYSKGKGRASLQKQVAACVFVTPDYLVLSVQKYVIDTRPVVVPATKGRVLRHRPRFDEWAVSFQLEYDETLITETQLRRIVDDTGRLVGLLDFRPEKKGPFGRYIVTEWKS